MACTREEAEDSSLARALQRVVVEKRSWRRHPDGHVRLQALRLAAADNLVLMLNLSRFLTDFFLVMEFWRMIVYKLAGSCQSSRLTAPHAEIDPGSNKLHSAPLAIIVHGATWTLFSGCLNQSKYTIDPIFDDNWKDLNSGNTGVWNLYRLYRQNVQTRRR